MVAQEPTFEHIPFDPPRFVRQTAGAAYIVALPTGNLKIGWSADFSARFRRLEAQYGGPVELLCAQYGGAAQEKILHLRFREYRLHGEEFVAHQKILEYADYIGVAIFHERWKSTNLSQQHNALELPRSAPHY